MKANDKNEEWILQIESAKCCDKKQWQFSVEMTFQMYGTIRHWNQFRMFSIFKFRKSNESELEFNGKWNILKIEWEKWYTNETTLCRKYEELVFYTFCFLGFLFTDNRYQFDLIETYFISLNSELKHLQNLPLRFISKFMIIK